MNPIQNKIQTPAYFLIASNLIPIIGVLFFNWNLFIIIFLYWAESGIIALYNIIKMALLKEGGIGGIERVIQSPLLWKFVKILNKVILLPFFIIHFSGFMFGHLVFIFALFSKDSGFSVSFKNFFDILKIIYPALITIFISHGISFYKNFILGKEYKKITTSEQMFLPYKRIVVMHITIIASGFTVVIFGSSQYAIILLIVVKTIVDLFSHLNEHKKKQSDAIT